MHYAPKFSIVAFALSLVAAGAASSCSSSTSNAAAATDAGPSGCTVSGTLLGRTLAVADCGVVIANGGPTAVATDIVVGDFAGVCGIATANAQKASSTQLDFHFNGIAVAPGTYAVGTNGLDVQYAVYDETCQSPVGESSTSGHVTITQTDSHGIAGSYDVMLNADHVTGTFNASTCAAVTGDAGPVSCK